MTNHATQYNELINHLTTGKHLTKSHRQTNLQRARRDIQVWATLTEDQRADLLGKVNHALRQIG